MKSIHAEIAPALRSEPQPVSEAVDARVVGLMRCLLALSALLILHVDPQYARVGAAAHGLLLGYCAYAIALHIFAYQRRPLLALRSQHWVDVAFFVSLVSFTHGTSSAFYHFFLFAILVASFSRGAREGYAVTVVSVVLFATVGLAATPLWPQVEFDRAVGRIIYLFLLGYMISYWGGHEFALRRRFNLLREISSIAYARLDVDHAVAHSLRQLMGFYRADGGLLVLTKPGARTRMIYRVDRTRGLADLPPDEVTSEIAKPLLSLSPALHAFLDLRGSWLRGGPSFIAWEADSCRSARGTRTQCEELADLLGADSFASVPYTHADGTAGRLYLVAPRERLSEADIVFLAQVVNQMAVTVSNVMLLDQLAAKAAQEERSKISRDIHDTNLQGYIGLKLGLEALYRHLRTDAPSAAARVKELLDIATLTVDDLRSYVRRLTATKVGPSSMQLADSLEEQARRYREYHGIDVALSCDTPAQMSERIGTEACQIVSEALSNVLRHTAAKHAYVDVRCEGASLAIEVGNAAPAERATTPFVPRSISERTLALGGKVQVRVNNEGHDVVRATIPLPRGTRSTGMRPAA